MGQTNTGRVALVTGAGSGMGEAISHHFAREGHAVGVLDIDAAGATRVAEAIHREGGRAMALVADITDRAAIRQAAAQLREAFGPVAILVNNAAMESFCPFMEIDDDNWDQVMNVNLKGMYIVTQTVLPDMEAAGWGRIVNIAAYGAQLSQPSMSHYFASKGGVISFTRGLAAEVGSKGITVNSVSPGFIDTPMARRAIEGDKFPVDAAAIYSAYPIPRLGRPEEIAAAVAFLASEGASYVTAQLLGVNGGAVV